MEVKKSLEERRKKAKVNVSKLSPEDAKQKGVELGKQIGIITNYAQESAQKLCSIYGLEVQVQIVLRDPKTGQIFTP